MGEMLYCAVETGPKRTVRAGLAYRTGGADRWANCCTVRSRRAPGVPYGRGWRTGEMLYCTVETGPVRTVRAGLAYRTGGMGIR
jgi:hypothetical protein